jgi:UPF0755 protein
VNIIMGKKIFLSIFTVLIVLGIGRFLFLGWIGSSSVGTTKRFVVEPGTSVQQVAKNLEEQSFIAGSSWYRLFSFVNGAARVPKPGTYTLQPGQRFSAIASILATGPEVDEVRIRIIEGWSIADIRNLLQKDHAIEEKDIRRVMGEGGDKAPFDTALRTKFAFLRSLPADRSLEGYLFPDTYRVWKAQLPEGLVQKQLEEFAERIATEKVTSASAPLTTLDEVVTLASIIEKEVSKPEDRKMVAGIFLRRLREGMPLQSDATVNYITRSGRSRATAEDLAIENPYNTYQNKGLPPGPIASPSEGALRAVLEPTPSTYRYFLTDEQGKIYYGRTLEEHIANRRKAGY